MSIDTVCQKSEEFALLNAMLLNYNNLPIKFLLKEYMEWDDEKIKSFMKSWKKQETVNTKKRKKASLDCCPSCQGE
jgi:hypothetical protein